MVLKSYCDRYSIGSVFGIEIVLRERNGIAHYIANQTDRERSDRDCSRNNLKLEHSTIVRKITYSSTRLSIEELTVLSIARGQLWSVGLYRF